jgi:hypothetical protein
MGMDNERKAGGAHGTPSEFVKRLVNQVPPAWREQASAILLKLISPAPSGPATAIGG